MATRGARLFPRLPAEIRCGALFWERGTAGRNIHFLKRGGERQEVARASVSPSTLYSFIFPGFL